MQPMDTLRNDLKKLYRELLKLGHEASDDTIAGLASGNPVHYLIVFSYICNQCDPVIRQEIRDSTCETILYDMCQAGQPGVEALYKVMYGFCHMTPIIVPHQFMMKRFAHHKVRMCIKLMEVLRKKEKKFKPQIKSSVSTPGDSAPNLEITGTKAISCVLEDPVKLLQRSLSQMSFEMMSVNNHLERIEHQLTMNGDPVIVD